MSNASSSPTRSRVAVAVAAVAVALVAASSTAGISAPTPPSYATASAQVRIGTSTALAPLANAAAKKYGVQATGISVSVAPVAASGSYVGLSDGSINVAFAGSAQTDKALVDRKIAVAPFAFVTNRAAGVSSLTAAQIRDLLSGKIANWNQIGGGDAPVRVIGRGSFGGIAQLLERRYLGGATIAPPASDAQTAAAAIAATTKTSGGITVVSFAEARAANANLTTLAIDGATADEAHVGDGSYPLWSYQYAITQGAPSSAVSQFLGSLVNDRELLHAFGYIAVSELGPGALSPSR